MYIQRSKIKVRYVETDRMGIVHHSNYYAWFEVGRGDFIASLGITYKQIEEMGFMLPLVESGCKYIEGAKYEDNLTIETWIEEISPVKVIFNYSVIRDEDHRIIAKGNTTHAFVDNNFKVVNLKKKNTVLWEVLSKC